MEKTFQKKRGKVSWKPATRLQTVGAPEGYTPRWCDSDPDNIERKQMEGWEFTDATKGTTVKTDVDEQLDPTSGAKRYRELVHMVLPDELKEARTDYFNQKTKEQTEGLKKRLQEEASKGGGAKIHGEITIK